MQLARGHREHIDDVADVLLLVVVGLLLLWSVLVILLVRLFFSVVLLFAVGRLFLDVLEHLAGRRDPGLLHEAFARALAMLVAAVA